LAPQQQGARTCPIPTDERLQLDAIIAQYRAELVRSNYVKGPINVYLRSIRRLFRLMEEQGVALGDQTSDVAADLVRRAPWRCDRQQYAMFIVKLFRRASGGARNGKAAGAADASKDRPHRLAPRIRGLSSSPAGTER
jgi:hypothetical protein